MTYTSLVFVVFVFGVFCLYTVTPMRFKWLCLLVASYIFYYLAAGPGLPIYLLITTISIFFLARVIENLEKNNKKYIKENKDSLSKEEKDKLKITCRRKKKLGVFVGVVLNLGILGYFKYMNFFIINLNAFFDFNISPTTLLIPLGISFYTFQSTGYLIDIYRGKYKADRNIAKFALFTSFFPQIVQGPISRYDQLAHQLYEGHRFNFTQVKHGAMLMIWGYFKKMVIADRAYVLVQYMFDNYTELHGFEVVIGVLAIALRSYADFSGGIDISRGVAQIFGVDLVQNFSQPYFATSIRNYWSRWHVTLGQWFRDYFYYPLIFTKGWGAFITWSRKHLGPKFGKLLPVAVGMAFTFFLVGVWHGAAWKYILFGVYNGTLVMIGMIITPYLDELNKKYHFIKIDTFSWRLVLIVGTFTIICFSKLITGSPDVTVSMTLIQNMFTEFNPWIFVDGTIYELGLQYSELNVLIGASLVLFVIDLVHESGVHIREKLDEQNTYFRWILLFVCIFAIIIFGMYGTEEIPDFVYQKF